MDDRLISFEALLNREVLESGFDTLAEHVLKALLQTEPILMLAYLDSVGKSRRNEADLLAKLLHITAHLDEALTARYRGQLAALVTVGLNHESIQVQEAALGVLESWRDLFSLQQLRNFHSTETWLQNHVNDIITELEEEHQDTSLTLPVPIGRVTIVDVFVYVDGPLVFSCKNADGQIFVANMVDYNVWFYVPVSQERVEGIMAGKVSLRECIVKAEGNTILEVITSDRGDVTIHPRSTAALEEDELPDVDSYVWT